MTDPTLTRSAQVPAQVPVAADSAPPDLTPPTAPVAPTSPTSPPSKPSNRRGLLVVLGVAGLVAILVLALAVVINGGFGGSSTEHAQHVATGGVNNRTEISLDIVSGVTAIAVRAEDLGGDLYRITTPDDSRQVPRVTDHDDTISVALAAAPVDGGGPDQLEVVLSTRVMWQLRISGGTQQATIDLRKATVSHVDLASGISTVEVWLPEPRGTATVRETGGANDFTVHVPAAAPARLTISGGAGSAVVDGVIHTGVSGNTVFAHTGWERAIDRWDVWLVGGVSKAWLDRQ